MRNERKSNCETNTNNLAFPLFFSKYIYIFITFNPMQDILFFDHNTSRDISFYNDLKHLYIKEMYY